MANYPHLPHPESFSDISFLADFDDFSAIGHVQAVTHEHQPSTPENRTARLTPFLGDNQFDTPSSGAGNDATDSPPIFPQNTASYLPSPEYFAEIDIELYNQQVAGFQLDSSGDHSFFAQKFIEGPVLQQQQFLFDENGYIQHATYESSKAGDYKIQHQNAGVSETASNPVCVDHHPIASSQYHSAALKLESPEGSGRTAEAPLSDGSPQRSSRHRRPRTKTNYAQSSEEEDSGDSGDGEYIDEEYDGPEQVEENREASKDTLTFTTQIKNIDEYRAILIAEEERLQNLALKAQGASKADFPTHPAGQQACVAEIMAAIHDFSDIVDKAGKNGKASQSHNRFEKGFYQQHEIEMKAWQLLIRIRDASHGDRLITKHIEDKYEGYSTFRDRFNSVINGLRRSKAMCKMMMDAAYIDRLAQAPAGEFKTKISNKKINGQRDVDNRRGRVAKKLGLDGAIDQAVIQETVGGSTPAGTPQTPSNNNTGVATSTPSTRKRKASSRLVEEGEGGDPFSGSPGSAKKRRSTPRKPASRMNPATPRTRHSHQNSHLGAHSPIDFGNPSYQTPIKFPELVMPTPNRVPEITPARMSNMSLAGTPDGLPRFIQYIYTDDQNA